MPRSSSAVSTLGSKLLVLIAVKSASTPGTAVPVCGVLTAAIPREGTRRVATDRNEKCPTNPRSVEWLGTSLSPRRSPPGVERADRRSPPLRLWRNCVREPNPHPRPYRRVVGSQVGIPNGMRIRRVQGRVGRNLGEASGVGLHVEAVCRV